MPNELKLDDANLLRRLRNININWGYVGTIDYLHLYPAVMIIRNAENRTEQGRQSIIYGKKGGD